MNFIQFVKKYRVIYVGGGESDSLCNGSYNESDISEIQPLVQSDNDEHEMSYDIVEYLFR